MKLHGSYEALRERELSDALVDFTGGVSEVIDFSVERYSEIEDKRSQLFDILLKESNDHSIICFTLSVSSFVPSINFSIDLFLSLEFFYYF